MSGVSFSFKNVKKSKIHIQKDAQKDNDESIEKDMLISVEQNELKGTKPKKEKKKEYIIPLIGTNKWRVTESESNKPTDDKGHGESQVTDDADHQAAQEILQDIARAEADEEQERVVPLLVQNKVPAGFETDDRLDVSLRPGEENVDYEQIPIAEFGKAMLRGMGWKEEQLDKNKSNIPKEVVARPKGLGLGAIKKNVTQMNYNGSQDKKEKEDLTLSKGAYCVVTSGRSQDLYGQVQGTDIENSRVIIKMALSGETITLSEFAINLVTKDEYKKYSKYLNKGKTDKYKEKKEKEKESEKQHRDSSEESHDQKNSNHNDRHRDDHRSDRHKTDDYRNSDESHSRKRKHKHSKKSSKSRRRSQSRESSPDSQRDSLQQLWLRPHLRVRVIDEHYKKGKYYKEKVTVEDIASIDCCVCRTDQGRVLEDLSQDQLETVVPKSQPAYVMIVAGKHRTQIAEVLKKDRDVSQATVQLLSDRNIVFVASFDDICEYMGDVSTEMDF